MNPTFGAAIASVVTYVLSIVFLALVTVYAVFRLNSTHIIREKVWSAFVGDKDFNDEKLKSFADEQLDLTRFRIVYGVPARSVTDLHRLLSWMEQHHLTPTQIKRVRRWIDPSRNELLETPRIRHVVARVITLGVLASACVLVFNASTDSQTTILKMKVSGTWFSSDGTSVRDVWGRWQIDAQSCTAHRSSDVPATGLTDAEVKAVCSGIADRELGAVVRNALKYQHFMLAIFSFLLLMLATSAWLSIDVAWRARRLGRELMRFTGDAPDAPLLLPGPISQPAP